MIETPERFIQIDEEGYFKMDDLRVADAESGREWLSTVTMDDRGRAWCRINMQSVLIEAYDDPFVALDIEKGEPAWTATMPYGHQETFRPESMSLDEWDRFHGRTERGVPFVLSRSAQARFFDRVDEFEDDAIIVDGRRIETQPWLSENPDANQNAWWTQVYRTETPGWELNAPAHILSVIVPKLKLQRMRVLVAGAGSGNDAAWFAEQGHIVTAIDFSEEAVARAKQKYAHVEGLKFLQADVFKLPDNFTESFDLVFEHTLYCAVTPSRRNELVKVWRRVLGEHGHLMGIFFAMDKPKGPPYGGSEFELYSRLKKGFRTLYWNRLREGLPKRLGTELFVYAQKRNAF